MRPLLTVLAILAAPTFAQEPDEPEIPEETAAEELGLGYPFNVESRIFRGERDAPAVFARLRGGGVLEIKVGDAWKEGTLDGLGTVLAVARDKHEIEQRKLGKPGLEEVSSGVKASRLFLALEADPGVPWQHLQWVMTIAMEQRIRKLEMVEGTRRLLVFLPVDRAICGLSDQPPPEIKAEVHVVVRAEQPAKWGDAEIQRPTEFRYKCGDAETASLAEVTGCLGRMKKAAEESPQAIFYGVIKAGNKVPYAKVFDVMEAFVEAGIANTCLYGTAIPPQSIRESKRLPYPAKNYATSD